MSMVIYKNLKISLVVMAASAAALAALVTPSFASATTNQILTPTGYKNISDIKVGDQVSAHDFDSGKNVVNTVERIDVVSDATYHYQDLYNFYLINNTYKFWKNQSVWASGRLVHVFELKVQDTIYDENLNEIKVTSIKKIKDPSQWYEFIISGNHSYIQDGLQLHNASRYWVGGGSTANWSATSNTNWSATSNGSNNASIPTTTTDVFFDGVGAGASDSTLSANITIRSLDMTGYTNTLTHNSSIALSIGDGTAGAGNNALIFGSLTYTSLGGYVYFISTSTTAQNVNFNGKVVYLVQFNGSGGSWKLTGSLDNGSGNSTSLAQGTLDLNGQTASFTGTSGFSASGSSTRTLTLGASTITATSWDISTTTNLTFNANTSTITINGTSATFAGGGLTYSDVSLTGASAQSITGANTFTNLTRTGTATKTNALVLSANQTVSSGLTLSGNSTTNRLLVKSDTLGTARTITANGITNLISNSDFRDITGAGSYGWDISGATGNSGDAGGNSGITFTTGKTEYWIAPLAGTSTGNWSDSTHWSATSGGFTGDRVPLPQDSATFDANSIDAGSRTITADMPRLAKNINWTGATNTPTWAINSTANTIYGSLTLISGMNLTANTSALVFEGRSSFTFTSAAKTFGPITMQMVGGTLTLQDNLAMGSTNAFTLSNGTFDANNKNPTFGLFSSSPSTTRTITMGSGTWTLTGVGLVVWNTSVVTGLTINQNTSTIKFTDTSSGNVFFDGGGKTFNNIWFSRGSSTGENVVYGSNTFADFKDDGSAAHYLWFRSGTTQTVTTFTVSGSSGNVINISSELGGYSGLEDTATHALTKSGGGTIDRDYLNIQHSVATPSSTWYAGTHSTNNQATSTAGSGWTFTAAPCNRYWVGGGSSANWSATGSTNWATSSNGSNNASVPDSTCNVFFDGVGAGASNSTLSADITINSLDMTGYANTLTHNSAVTLTISGGAVTFKLVSGMTYTLGSATTSAISFTGTSGTTSITTGTKTLGNTTFNGSGGNFELQDALTTGGNLTITAGTLDTKSGSNYGINVAGNWSNAGTFTARSGTVTLNGTATGKTITTGGSSFYDLTVNGSGGAWTLQDATTISDVLTVTAGTLAAGSVTLTLSGTTGTPLPTINGSLTCSTCTISYTGNNAGGNTTIRSVGITYYNLTINNASETYVLSGSLTTNITNNLTITAGTLDVTASDYNISVSGNWSNSGTFTARSGLVSFAGTGSGGQVTSGGSSFYDVAFTGSGGTYTLQDALAVDNNLTITAGTLQLAAQNLTVTGTTSLTGTLNDNSATGTNIFVGAVTINSGGIWTETNNPGFTFRGGLTENSSSGFTSGTGTYTFDTNAQTISGTQSFTITNLTNNVTTSTGLTFSGAQPTVTTLTQGSSSQLTFSGTMPTITTLTATASGNTVTYSGSAQALFVVSYVNLTLSGSGTATGAVATVTGALNLSGSVSWSQDAITSTMTSVTLNSSGTFTLGANMTTSGTLTLTQGTIDANGKNVTAASFSSSNSNTRTITMGSGTWTLSGTGTVWTTATTTGLTLNQNTSTITISDTSSTSKTFAGGGKTYNIFTITGSGTGAVIFTGANTFGNFTVNAPKTITFPASTTTTFSGTFTCSGSSGNVITLNSSSGGTQHTLSKASGTVDCDYMSIQDSAATGGATWNAGVNSTSVSNNSGWIFGTPTYNQEHFRFYSDNTVPAGLNTANPLAAQDTNYNVGVSTTFRLRIETANTGTGAGSITRRLEFKEDSGSWTQITTSTNNVRLSDSSNFTDGAATTTRLTAVGTFQAGQGKDTSSDTSSLSLTNGNYTEDEYSLILQSTASGHSYSFRITNSGTALDTYSVTPAINTPDATPPVPSGFNPATTSTIKTATPNITFNLDEAGDCKASTTNASYAAMSGADCTGDGSTAGSCTMPSLGSNGSKTIYFACQDVWGNQDTSGTTHSVTYTLNLSSGTTNPTLTIKGLGKVKGSGVAK